MILAITDWILIGTTCGLVLYDVFAYIEGGVEATISRRLVGWSKQYPAIPFAFGLLMGHLFL